MEQVTTSTLRTATVAHGAPGRSSGRGTRPRAATTRAAKRERLRAKVELVALELFREHGFDAVTVEQIATAAGVGSTTFYRYFSTKDGVLFAYQPRWLQALRDAAEVLEVDQPRPHQLRDLLGTIVSSFDAELETMGLRDEIVAASPTLLPRTLAVQRAWEQELAGSLAARRRCPPGDLPAATDAALVLVLMRMAFRRWRAGASASLPEAVSDALAAAEGGLVSCARSANPGAVSLDQSGGEVPPTGPALPSAATI